MFEKIGTVVRIWISAGGGGLSGFERQQLSNNNLRYSKPACLKFKSFLGAFSELLETNFLKMTVLIPRNRIKQSVKYGVLKERKFTFKLTCRQIFGGRNFPFCKSKFPTNAVTGPFQGSRTGFSGQAGNRCKNTYGSALHEGSRAWSILRCIG